ncbi:TPA: hypothetical protein ACGDUJ_002695 [Acinetobacter baumannii]|uniref:hypothetical protein n=1 Tax=Acinetobacter baumannii TaxID=470 RepID=UPI002447230F|nr:hypothetical protein [Acinetobacter baumannii]MDH2573390.1 hypothetical protein [Acinetobacter baumannii]MDO7530670.1 hypothetical protein [Acinetobacter baumannii]MDQ2391363.1 hypothetical protein [Acinetobacter baumannii]
MASETKTESSISIYWKAYGGWKALWSSIYLKIAIVITLICSHTWLNEKWMEDAITALPSLLGFSLGGYAVWLSIGDERLKKILYANKDITKPSAYMRVNAAFVHFIFLQVICLLYMYFLKYNSSSAILHFFEKDWIFTNEFYLVRDLLVNFLNAFGFFLFIYSILSMLAAVFAIFRIARWTDRLNRNNHTQPTDRAKCPDCMEDVHHQAKKCKHCGAIFKPINDINNPS